MSVVRYDCRGGARGAPWRAARLRSPPDEVRVTPPPQEVRRGGLRQDHGECGTIGEKTLSDGIMTEIRVFGPVGTPVLPEVMPWRWKRECQGRRTEKRRTELRPCMRLWSNDSFNLRIVKGSRSLVVATIPILMLLT